MKNDTGCATLDRIREIVEVSNNSTAEEDMWEIRQILEGAAHPIRDKTLAEDEG